MGGKNVAKKYRSTKAGNINTLLVESLDALGQVRYDADQTIKGKTLGLDLSVVLHKALGDITSALEFQIQPPVPVSKIDDVLNKMILLFKRCEVKLLACTEGKHHKYKGRVNEQRKKKQSGVQESVEKLVEQFKREPSSKLIDEIKKQMKYSVYVREDILAHAVDLLEENGIEVLSAPYEADFQLVYWELMGITEGTITLVE
ncbi:hypothetical protein THAOC_20709 [Thalassiosira oceanica]|uniref:Exonuclease 1 n=1 Tax=Thalassiosira oceanica TaxID=159749 RepID=K0S1H3_THAOC|nr:hypothetical protein THAOC_20709 [Thalassiosira oceanica]|eukprot:EJK59105.1 hypothetical protein THAOC_20709 [Thalassiosira oceanica]